MDARFSRLASAASLALAALAAPHAIGQLIIGSGSGSPEVTRFNSLLQPPRSFPGTPDPTGGVRVATGDINGDGVLDTIIGTSPGLPTRVVVLDGTNDQPLFTPVLPAFIAESTAGVFVTTADFNGDGRHDVVVGTDAGISTKVLVYDSLSGAILHDFFPFGPRAAIGVRVAAADVNGDGVPDLIAGVGPGVQSTVRVFHGVTRAVLHDFLAYDATFLGGIFVAATDLNGDGRAEIITGPDAGGDPVVRFFDPTDIEHPFSRTVAPATNTFGIRVGTIFVPPTPLDPEPQKLVVIAIIAVLIGLLLPAVQKIAPDDSAPVQLWLGADNYANRHVYVAGAPAPIPPPCPPEFNGDGTLNADDLADFITCFFLDVQFPGTCPQSDFNADTFRDPDDLSDFITAFFLGC